MSQTPCMARQSVLALPLSMCGCNSNNTMWTWGGVLIRNHGLPFWKHEIRKTEFFTADVTGKKEYEKRFNFSISVLCILLSFWSAQTMVNGTGCVWFSCAECRYKLKDGWTNSTQTNTTCTTTFQFHLPWEENRDGHKVHSPMVNTAIVFSAV